jgi:hypothetical protein
VYTASPLAEAHLVRQLLDSAGIEARVFNQNAHAALGELPATETWPQVWVTQNHQLSPALTVIDRYESGPGEELQCHCCAEYSPGSFEVCWCCHKPLPASG